MSWFAHDRPTRRARAWYRLTRRVLGNMSRRLRFRTALFLGRCRFKLVTVWQRALRIMSSVDECCAVVAVGITPTDTWATARDKLGIDGKQPEASYEIVRISEEEYRAFRKE